MLNARNSNNIREREVKKRKKEKERRKKKEKRQEMRIQENSKPFRRGGGHGPSDRWQTLPAPRQIRSESAASNLTNWLPAGTE